MFNVLWEKKTFFLILLELNELIYSCFKNSPSKLKFYREQKTFNSSIFPAVFIEVR